MPYLSRKSIEAIARRITAAYMRLPPLQSQLVNMIQPELLVHDLLGLTIEYRSLSKNGAILGLTACGEVDIQIYDDPKRPEYFHLDGRTLLIERDLVKEGAILLSGMLNRSAAVRCYDCTLPRWAVQAYIMNFVD